MSRCLACSQENCGRLHPYCTCSCHAEDEMSAKNKSASLAKTAEEFNRISSMKLAAIITKHISVPGDERSRTHPGHGYPAHDVAVIELREFKTQADMEKWVKDQTSGGYGSKPAFRLIKYEELTYEHSVTIKVNGL